MPGSSSQHTHHPAKPAELGLLNTATGAYESKQKPSTLEVVSAMPHGRREAATSLPLPYSPSRWDTTVVTPSRMVTP